MQTAIAVLDEGMGKIWKRKEVKTTTYQQKLQANKTISRLKMIVEKTC